MVNSLLTHTESPLLILGAMEEETAIIAAAIEKPEEHSVGCYPFVQGNINGVPLILGRTYMGMTNAAAACALGIERFNPYSVISLGLAGAHNPSLHKGDIVLGKTLRHIHYIETAPASANMGIHPHDWNYSGPEIMHDNKLSPCNELQSDSTLLAVAQSVAGNWQELNGHSVHAGTIGSGDVWNKEADRIRALRALFNTDCEDMESFSVAQVCYHLGVPFLAIRIISNSELYPEETYDSTLGSACQDFVLRLIREF